MSDRPRRGKRPSDYTAVVTARVAAADCTVALRLRVSAVVADDVAAEDVPLLLGRACSAVVEDLRPWFRARTAATGLAELGTLHQSLRSALPRGLLGVSVTIEGYHPDESTVPPLPEVEDTFDDAEIVGVPAKTTADTIVPPPSASTPMSRGEMRLRVSAAVSIGLGVMGLIAWLMWTMP